MAQRVFQLTPSHCSLSGVVGERHYNSSQGQQVIGLEALDQEARSSGSVGPSPKEGSLWQALFYARAGVAPPSVKDLGG